jgi:competence protein ComEC
MKNLINIAIFLLISSCANLWINYSRINSQLEIYILDIGQGDAILIKTPENNLILVDGGKDKFILNELGKVLPYWANSIDVIIATHPDLDHIGGLYEVAEDYNVDTFFINRVHKDSETFSNLKIEASKKDNYQINYLNDFEIDNLKFDIIWPEDLTTLSSLENINDTSISFKLSYNNFTFLSMGDLNDEFELKALQNCECEDIDVLKVSHHGSKTSTPQELLDTINPKISVIAVGMNNSYGHPHKGVVDRIEKNNSFIYRTDRDGRIKIITNGKNILVETGKTKISDKYSIF